MMYDVVGITLLLHAAFGEDRPKIMEAFERAEAAGLDPDEIELDTGLVARITQFAESFGMHVAVWRAVSIFLGDADKKNGIIALVSEYITERDWNTRKAKEARRRQADVDKAFNAD